MAKTSRFEMRIDPDLLEAVDRARGDVTRALFVTRALRLAVAGEADPAARAKAERDARAAARRPPLGVDHANARAVSPSLQRFMDGKS